ncbi:hypothetical protein HK098_007812 [Nowakowskiella sp. JEL0407]|nr:hypothetical protein HK098_007812 [Nowakowskiella sp. JEL0407]
MSAPIPRKVIFITYRHEVCKSHAELLERRLFICNTLRLTILKSPLNSTKEEWREIFETNIRKSDIYVPFMSDNVANNESTDDLIYEWNYVTRRLDIGTLQVLPLFVHDNESGKESLDTTDIETIAVEKSTASFTKFNDEFTKIGGMFVDMMDSECLNKVEKEIYKLGPLGISDLNCNRTRVSDAIKIPPYFVGREDLLAVMNEKFSSPRQCAVVIHGGPGTGKTSVAKKFISNVLQSEVQKYTHILWFDVSSEIAFHDSVCKNARLLNIQHDDNMDKKKMEVFLWMRHNSNFLVVFDSVDDTSKLRYCVGDMYDVYGHVIVTSRYSIIEEYFRIGVTMERTHRREIQGWDEKSARKYISYRLEYHPLTTTPSESEEEALKKILEFMDGYPLLIEQMCSFLLADETRMYSRYYELILANDKDIWDQSPMYDIENYKRSIEMLVYLQIDYLVQSGHKGACVQLGLVSYMDHKLIPIRTVLEKCDIIAGFGQFDHATNLSMLINTSMVDFDYYADLISMHPAIQDIIRRTLDYKEFISMPFDQLLIVGLTEVFPKMENDSYAPNALTDGTALLPHIVVFYRKTQIRSLEFATICHDAAVLAKHISNFDVAEALFKNTIEIYQQVYETRNHENVVLGLNNLGLIAASQGKFEDAKELYSECLDIYKNVYETKKHLNVAETIHNLASVIEQIGDYEDAKKSYLESLAILEEVIGTRVHKLFGTALHSLGSIEKRQGNCNEAKRYYTESLQIKEQIYGTREHLEVVNTINDLGTIAEDEGDYEIAKRFYNEAILTYEKILGKREHPGIAAMMNKLGRIARNEGNYAEAKARYTEVLAIEEKVHNTRQNLSVATTIKNIGLIAKLQEEYEEAVNLYTDAITIFETVFGDREHPEIASALCEVGVVYEKLEKNGDAREKFTESLRIYEKLLGSDDPSYQAVLNELLKLDEIENPRGPRKRSIEEKTSRQKRTWSIYSFFGNIFSFCKRKRCKRK